MTDSWLAAAEQHADAARDLGFDVAATVAAAWQARCLPDATRALVQATGALTSGDALPRLWEKVPPCPSARDYLAAAEDHEADAATMARHARDLGTACSVARDDAITAHERARQQAMLASGHPAPAAQATVEAACEVMDAMRRVAGDCEAALDVTTATLERLEYAVKCLRQAQEAFADAYDVPLQFIRAGGALPWSGDFLTGAQPGLSG